MLDSEPLLLVDDDKAEVFELDRAGQEPVGADDNVDGSGFESFDDFLGVLFRLEAGQSRNGDRETRIPLLEGLKVLGDEQGRGDKNSNLFRVLDGFEGARIAISVLP